MIGGTVNISRSLWTDEAFGNEPFSEREAWIWMIAEASWKPRKKRVGDYIVSLERGQLAHSTRFLANTWQWTHSKARRFIDRLEKLDLIRRETGTGVSVISICKYDTYQNAPHKSGTRPAQDRHTSGTNENKGEIRESTSPIPPEGAGEVSLFSYEQPTERDRFEEFWTAYPHRNGVKKGKSTAQRKWKSARARGVSQQVMIDGAKAARRHPDVIRGYARDPTTWINQCGWDDEIPSVRPDPHKSAASGRVDFLLRDKAARHA